ncbi:MAG: ABC transporter ATP-binding protein [Anaerolineae bacterium]|nr:ABC transporter ATP-binding protein [Anaerolineae bacterium]
MLLEVRDLHVSYGSIKAVHGVSFDVDEGEIVTLIGANGAGKSTILNTVAGLQSPDSGSIRYEGEEIGGWPAHKIVQHDLALVPEGRRIFGNLTVYENLRLAGFRIGPEELSRRVRRVFEVFPRLEERRGQLGDTLSGGEQQMLAVGRALVTGGGKLMLLDEPSMGLAPILVKQIFGILREINQQGTTILLVEQNANQALKLATRGYVLETGNIVLAGTARELAQNPEVQKAYLGG